MNILNIPAATGPDAGVTRGIDGGVSSIHVGCDVIINPQTKKKKDSSRRPASEAEIIDAWLAERCICGAAAGKGRTPAADLFADFVAWGRGQSLATVTQTAFGRHLRTRGIMGAKRAEGGRVMRWPIQFRAPARAGLGGSDLDPHERDKARRLAAMPAADVYSAFRGRAG